MVLLCFVQKQETVLLMIFFILCKAKRLFFMGQLPYLETFLCLGLFLLSQSLVASILFDSTWLAYTITDFLRLVTINQRDYISPQPSLQGAVKQEVRGSKGRATTLQV